MEYNKETNKDITTNNMKTWNEFLSECRVCWATEGQQGDKAVNAALNHPDTRNAALEKYGVKWSLTQYASEAYKTYKNLV